MKRKPHKKGFHPLLFLFGRVCVSFSAERLSELVNICRAAGISYRSAELVGESGELEIPFFSKGRLFALAEARGIELEEIYSGGLPQCVLFLARRPGIYVGALLASLIIFFSGQLIWDIRFDGATHAEEDEVRQLLRECGLDIGAKRHGHNLGAIENHIMLASDGISFVNVNIRGTVATVTVRSRLTDGKEEYETDASNLVASSGGVIVGLENIKGSLAVNLGDAVSEGQLLVSGIWGSEDRGFCYTNAEGRVLAEVNRTLNVEIERNFLKKVYTGEEKCEKYLIFFKKNIKFFGNCRNLYPTYDTIDIVEYLYAPSGDALPVGILTRRYVEYRYEDTARSDSEMQALAHYRLDALLSYELQSGELLRKNTQYEQYDNSCKLVCDIKCVEDIAKRRTVDVGTKPLR